MKYISGEKVLVGDTVKISEGAVGMVVHVINKNSSKDSNYAEWAFLKEGFLLKSEEYGLMHIKSPDEDLILLKRS